jgi:hypothetical protein
LPGKNLSGKALFKSGADKNNFDRHLKIRIHVQNSKFLSVLMFSFSSRNRMIAHDKWDLGKSCQIQRICGRMGLWKGFWVFWHG